jgi:hypothetical protein
MDIDMSARRRSIVRLPRFYAKKRGHRRTGSREWGVFGDGLFHGTLLVAGLCFGLALAFAVASPVRPAVQWLYPLRIYMLAATGLGGLFTGVGFGLDNAAAAAAAGVPQAALGESLLASAPLVAGLAYAYAGLALLLLPAMLGTFIASMWAGAVAEVAEEEAALSARIAAAELRRRTERAAAALPGRGDANSGGNRASVAAMLDGFAAPAAASLSRGVAATASRRSLQVPAPTSTSEAGAAGGDGSRGRGDGALAALAARSGSEAHCVSDDTSIDASSALGRPEAARSTASEAEASSKFDAAAELLRRRQSESSRVIVGGAVVGALVLRYCEAGGIGELALHVSCKPLLLVTLLSAIGKQCVRSLFGRSAAWNDRSPPTQVPDYADCESSCARPLNGAERGLLPGCRRTTATLARAVVLYHAPGRWTDAKQLEWNRLTGQSDDSSAALSTCLVDMAKAVLEAEVRIDLGPTEVSK